MRLALVWLPTLTRALVPVPRRAVSAPRLSAATLKEPITAPPLNEKNEAVTATAAETDRAHGFAEGPSVDITTGL